MIAALAFLAGVVVGVGGRAAVSCCVASSRMSRAEGRWLIVDTRPFDDRRPEERR